jgi:biotin carboxylase
MQMTRKPVLIINAAGHDFMSHGSRSFVPFDEIEPYLLTTPYHGVDDLDPDQYPNVAVCELREPEELLAAARWMIRENGIGAITAPHEKYLVLAAQLRTEFGMPGLQHENAILFRDKVKMKEALAAADVRIPEFTFLDDIDQLSRQDWSTGSKIIKSRFGVGGQHVYHVDSLEAARVVWKAVDPGPGQFEIEEFIDGVMYHVDSLVADGKTIFTTASRYLAKPADFALGGMFGSVTVRNGALLDRIIDFNSRALTILGMTQGATHLELFHQPNNELVFCEVAARPGGAGIDRALDLCFDINMVEGAIRLESGLDVRLPPAAFERVAGPVWGFVGTYLTGNGAQAPIAPELYDSLGIAEYQPGPAHQLWPPGPSPRHCSDFEHRYIMQAPDQASFERQYQALGELSARTRAA